MGKLRHIAIQVPDLEKAAAFYEGVFGLKRLKKVDAPIGKNRFFGTVSRGLGEIVEKAGSQSAQRICLGGGGRRSCPTKLKKIVVFDHESEVMQPCGCRAAEQRDELAPSHVCFRK